MRMHIDVGHRPEVPIRDTHNVHQIGKCRDDVGPIRSALRSYSILGCQELFHVRTDPIVVSPSWL